MTAKKQERFIGIRHRVKFTADGDSHPTQVCIMNSTGAICDEYELPTESDELDWNKGRFPRTYQTVLPDMDISAYPEHQLKLKRLGKDEKPDDFPSAHIRRDGKTYYVVIRVPKTFDGLQAGDQVAMLLGGSGDPFAFAISSRGDKIGASLYRIPPFMLKEIRKLEKDKDAQNLASLLCHEQELFYLTQSADRDLIMVRENLRARTDAMKARIACEQRLHQRVIGQMFCSEEGEYPEGSIEKAFDAMKASDAILVSLVAEEKARDKALKKAVENFWVYQEIFAPITGFGPAIAGRIMAAIQDIRRFPTAAKLKAFCGVHVMRGGRFGQTATEKQFVRRRTGQVANWSGDTRQALFLFADQCNRRPDSEWGKELLRHKAHFRSVHPEPIVVTKADGREVSRYTDGHILKMAKWRTATKFVEWLWDEWTRLEAGRQKKQQSQSLAKAM